MTSDPAAVAESIVVHAETLCEREDHLWDVIRQLSIPVDDLEDARDQNQADFGTDEMFRTLLFKGIQGISQNELAQRLGREPTLVKSFHFDITDLEKTPPQQELSYAHGKSSTGRLLASGKLRSTIMSSEKDWFRQSQQKTRSHRARASTRRRRLRRR
jgi:hypothetical protein